MDTLSREFEVMTEATKSVGVRQVVVKVRSANRNVLNDYFVKEAVIEEASKKLHSPGIRTLQGITAIDENGQPYSRQGNRYAKAPVCYEASYLLESIS